MLAEIAVAISLIGIVTAVATIRRPEPPEAGRLPSGTAEGSPVEEDRE